MNRQFFFTRASASNKRIYFEIVIEIHPFWGRASGGVGRDTDERGGVSCGVREERQRSPAGIITPSRRADSDAGCRMNAAERKPVKS